MGTLLLNASYEPLRVLPEHRAINLVLQDKAEVIVGDDNNMIHAASFKMPTPSVIRLKYFVKVPYRARLPLTRQSVLTRDNYECQFTHCTRKATTIDHVHPRSRGGKHAWENVAGACSKCNSKKAAKTLDEIGWKLKSQPYAPAGDKWLFIGMRPKPEWAPFLTGF